MQTSIEQTVNIGPRERKLRLILGIVLLIVTLIVAWAMITSSMSTWWGLVLLPFFYQGTRFILDYQTGTCPMKAELGQRKLDATFSTFGEEVGDEELSRSIRAKSRKALVQAAVVAVLLTALTVVLMTQV